VRAAGAELVVSQTAERFIGRVPLVRVDASELVRRGSGREPIPPGAIFGDRQSDGD
jgi:hypothetical protein